MNDFKRILHRAHDHLFPVTTLLRDRPFAMVFKTTNYCWYSCAHCCESSGPNQPRTYIPLDVACAYMDAAALSLNFDKNVVFTGGEIMTAYKFGPTDYVPKLLNHALRHRFSVNIKTNGGWANAAFGQKIFDDLAQIIANNPPYSLSISISLDDYHLSSVVHAAKIIHEIAQRPNQHVYILLSGFASTMKPLMVQLMARLNRMNIHPEQGLINNGGNCVMPVLCVDKTRICSSVGTLFAHGRAAHLSNAKPVDHSRFQIMSADKTVLMAFDSQGHVTLGENSGPKISAPWRTGANMHSLGKIRRDLISAARWAEIGAWLSGSHPMSR